MSISTATTALLADFAFTFRRFRVDLARTAAERELCFRLRHEVFLDELLGRPRADGIDRDDFDASCEHLLVRLASTDEAVGTCRLACSLWANRSYSSSEFHLGGVPALPGVKIEVGRTCLRRAHRNNLALVALGHGVGAFAQAVGARWLFGCSSIPAAHPRRIAALAARFAADGMTRGACGVLPRTLFRDVAITQALVDRIAPASDAEVEALVPPLLRIYLRADAAVSAEPALDRDFGCYDFFTLLDLQHHNSAFLGRLAPC